MMWKTHAATGMAGAAALLPLLPIEGSAAQLAVVITCGGAALLPDWDHPQSSVTRMWGPASKLVHHAIGKLAGGHRGATHDWVLAPIVAGGIALLAALNPWTALLILAVTIGATLRALSFVIPGHAEKSWPINLVASFTLAYLLLRDSGMPWWLPIPLAVGTAMHIAGDRLTKGSVPKPLGWLRSSPAKHAAGPLTTNSRLERWIIAPVLLVLTAVLLAIHVPAASDLFKPAARVATAIVVYVYYAITGAHYP